MSTLTIILLAYVILDITIDTIAIICLRRKGYTFRDIAYRIRSIFKSQPQYEYEDYDDDDEWVDDQGYGDLEEES